MIRTQRSEVQPSSYRYPFQLQPLPWDKNSLVPFLSERAITLHYDGNYAGYIRKMNELANQYPELQSKTLPEIVQGYTVGPFHNIAAQIINHDFFWRCLSPNGGVPSGRLYDLIQEQFGSYENFVLQFNQTAINLFGSGWVWLVYDPKVKYLLIVNGKDAYNPIIDGYIPLLTLDVWEHAFYPDYVNNKTAYVQNFWKFVNWTYIEQIAAEQIFNYQVRVSL